MRICALAMLVTLAAVTRPAAAQWYVGLELGAAQYGGSARDTSGNPHAGPGGATTVGLRVERSIGRLRGALRLSYGKPGFSVSGEGIRITDKTAGQLIESAALVSFRVGGIGPSGAVRAELGPALHLWKVGDEFRARLGAVGAAAYEWPVAGRFSGAIRLEGALSKSWFDAADLPPEYERRVTWRYGVTSGLRHRL